MLDIDDGVVDHEEKRRSEPHEDHCIERHPEGVQHDHRDDERHRDRDDADQGGSEPEEERPEEEDRQHGADDEPQAEVVDRLLDVGGGPVHRGVEVDTRHAGPHRVDRVLDRTGHRKGVRFRELLDHEQQAVAVADDGLSDEGLMAFDHRGDVAEGELLPLLALEPDLGEVGRRRHG